MNSITTPRLRTEVPTIVVPRRTAAVVAGAGYVAMFALAVFANFVVVEGLVVTDGLATRPSQTCCCPWSPSHQCSARAGLPVGCCCCAQGARDDTAHDHA